MANRNIVITAIDRLRLANMIQAFHAAALERREYLDALEAELGRARVVEPTEMPADVITMNSTVRLRDLDADQIETYTLVYPDFAEMSEHCISILDPLGTAIIGYRIGDVIQWQAPDGPKRLKVEEMSFQPERAGRYDL